MALRSWKVTQVVDDDPAEEEGEKSVHEMLLQDVLAFHHLVVHSQVLVDVQVAEGRTSGRKGNDAGESHDAQQRNEDAED